MSIFDDLHWEDRAQREIVAMARILLVEDDLDVRPLMEHILLSKGYQVTTAESVGIATATVSSQPFDLVICDVNLPDGSELTVADKAKAVGVKALVVTRHGLNPTPSRLAPYDYLLKPVRVAELFAGIERCLAEKGGESEVIRFQKPAT
jgi:DNA-binding NtrC family response regulator